jgi:trehalose 6-phosphate phosphatase
MSTSEITEILQRSPLGLIFDIDGTLSPIAPTPTEARLYPGTSELLHKAQKFAHVGIMTGRAVVDGAQLVGVDGITYIGTHGLEWCDGLPGVHEVKLAPEAIPYVEPGRYVLDLAEKELAGLAGIIIQHKQVGGSIHYRQTVDPEEARRQILTKVAEPAHETGMKIGYGKRVIEVLAPVTINKGHGLRYLVEHFKLRGVVFAGDDRTDLDAILEVKQLRQEGIAAHAIVVQHSDTLPVLLKHADSVVYEVEGMIQQLQTIVDQLAEAARS